MRYLLKKVCVSLGLLLLIAPLFLTTLQQTVHTEEKIEVEFFWGDGCPHCAKAKPFLDELEKKYDNINLTKYEIYKDQENSQLLISRAEKLDIPQIAVPTTIIEDEYILGYSSDQTTGAEIENAIVQAIENKFGRDNYAQKDEEMDNIPPVSYPDSKDGESMSKSSISVPILGTISKETISLPLLAIVLGTVDGFNPCAMWILVFLITLLIQVKDRKKLIIYGTTFIVASTLVYTLIMIAWLNLFIFLGFISWVRNAIGLLAITVGTYYIYNLLTQDDGCTTVDREKRKGIMDRIKEIVTKKQYLVALPALVLLAFSVNIIEVTCSAGLPAVFTSILSLRELSLVSYALYIFLYMLFFMIDDLIIFGIAIFTLEVVGIQQKYIKATRWIGAIVLILLGLLLIVKPELLMFG